MGKARFAARCNLLIANEIMDHRRKMKALRKIAGELGSRFWLSNPAVPLQLEKGGFSPS
jgi:hypothetical protein